MYRLEQVLSLYMNIKIWQVWANWEDFCFSWAAIVCAPQVEEQALQLLCPAPPPLPTSYLLVGFPSCRSSSMACPSLLFWTWPKLAELILRNLGSDNFWMESFLLVRVALWLGFWTNVASELSWRYFLAGQPGRRLQEHEVHWHLSTSFWCQVPINQGNKDHQRSWSAWQHCTNVTPSPISFRWRRLSLRTKKVCPEGRLFVHCCSICSLSETKKLIKPTMFNRTTVVLAGAVTIEAKDHKVFRSMPCAAQFSCGI